MSIRTLLVTRPLNNHASHDPLEVARAKQNETTLLEVGLMFVRGINSALGNPVDPLPELEDPLDNSDLMETTVRDYYARSTALLGKARSKLLELRNEALTLEATVDAAAARKQARQMRVAQRKVRPARRDAATIMTAMATHYQVIRSKEAIQPFDEFHELRVEYIARVDGLMREIDELYNR